MGGEAGEGGEIQEFSAVVRVTSVSLFPTELACQVRWLFGEKGSSFRGITKKQDGLARWWNRGK